MDERWFKQQFLPFHSKLYRIAFALTGNKQDAEDIVQEVYCKLWDKRKELADIRSPEAFCVTLTRNRSLDYLRSSVSRNLQEKEDAIIVANNCSPETNLIEQDRIHVINLLINELPENQRQIIRLRGIDGCSAEEIEEMTGLSAVNIHVLLSRARKTIREKFEKWMNDDGR